LLNDGIQIHNNTYVSTLIVIEGLEHALNTPLMSPLSFIKQYRTEKCKANNNRYLKKTKTIPCILCFQSAKILIYKIKMS